MILLPEELSYILENKTNEEILAKYQEFLNASVAYYRLGKIQQAIYFKQIAEQILNFQKEKKIHSSTMLNQNSQTNSSESETKDLGNRRIIIRPFQKNNEPEVY
jgi:hypothetical protein